MPAIRGSKSKKKTRRYTRDIDQIYRDNHDVKHLERFKETKCIDDLPALGQWYCKVCATWFESEHHLNSHQRGKPHKRKLRQLNHVPYTQREADLAVGLGVSIGNFSSNDKKSLIPTDAPGNKSHQDYTEASNVMEVDS